MIASSVLMFDIQSAIYLHFPPEFDEKCKVKIENNEKYEVKMKNTKSK